eukprot:Phypoly_transcript_09974.p1 GENE.Phypoly_transcript_09974~~Phypoly_transcript_09974.p1  ORF type:complete len:381 (+),score=79.61 Phypoly_transcript_09974:105-1247(+)
MSAMDVICVIVNGQYTSTPFYIGISTPIWQQPMEEKREEQVHVIVNYKTIHEVSMTKDINGNVLFSGLGSVDGRRVPSHRDLACMGLKKGQNSIAFATAVSNQMVSARIFLWEPNEKIIVTDIDGTITRSDKRGHFYSRVGLNWHHNSVVTCFNAIYRLGYKILYLTARSVSMDVVTRKYLDDLNLPAGPLLLSSKGFMEAFTSEVITKDSKMGKFEHLSNVMRLFPPSNDVPIVAGFGNNENDEWAYKEAGVPPDYIFIVNKKSEILVAKSKTSYEVVEKEVCKFFKNLVENLKNDSEMLPENSGETLGNLGENPLKTIEKEGRVEGEVGGEGWEEGGGEWREGGRGEEEQNGANGSGSVETAEKEKVELLVDLSGLMV